MDVLRHTHEDLSPVTDTHFDTDCPETAVSVSSRSKPKSAIFTIAPAGRDDGQQVLPYPAAQTRRQPDKQLFAL
jgi:hypothetical protein